MLSKLKIYALSLFMIGNIFVPSADARIPKNNAQTQQIISNNFSVTQSNLRNQLDTYVNSGQMSAQQANSFRAQLDQIGAVTPRAIQYPDQTQELVNQFNGIASSINTTLSAPGSFRYTNMPYSSFVTRNGVNGRWNDRFYNNRKYYGNHPQSSNRPHDKRWYASRGYQY